MKSARSSAGKALSNARSRQGGRVLSISKFNCPAISTNEFSSAECSQPQPRSKTMPGAGSMVWARPPARSRASSTMVERPESFNAFAAPRPAAPMMATLMSEGRDMRGRMVSGEWRVGYSKRGGAETPSICYSLLAIRLFIRHSPFALYLRHFLLGLFRALAVVGVEELLAQADRLRGHFDQLVVLDIGQRLFQRHLDRRGQAH